MDPDIISPALGMSAVMSGNPNFEGENNPEIQISNFSSDDECDALPVEFDASVAAVTENISKARLTLEEIIAIDNDASRQQYLPSPTLSYSFDDASSISSTFESDAGSFCTASSNCSSSCSSSLKHHSSSSSSSSLLKSHHQNRAYSDSFKGTLDEDFSNLDRYGFLSLHGSRKFNEQGFEERERRKIELEKEKEASRALKWLSMLKTLESESSVNRWPVAHKKFLPRLLKGIPDCLRSRVWSKLLETRGLYAAPTLRCGGETEFPSLYLKVSGFERQIDLDIERTLRDHILFKIRYSQAQISLFKILVAYSNLDVEVGYCQGMSTIAAFLLLYFDESAAFDAFVRLMARDELRLMYRTGFPLLFEYFWIQERLMKKFLPSLWVHLSKHSITTSIYATKWYLTLFLSFPTRLAARIWDLFLFYGMDILPLTAVALLKMHEKRICGMGFEETMQFLSRIADAPSCSCPDELMRMIGKLGEKYFGTHELDPEHSRGFRKYRNEYSKL